MSPPGPAHQGLGILVSDDPPGLLRLARAHLDDIRITVDAFHATIDSLAQHLAALEISATAEKPSAGRDGSAGSRWLTVTQAMEEFGLKRKWLHVHWREVPGAGKAGKKLVLIPRAGLERLIKRGRDL